jgi:uncharacterized protein (TIGR02996 family)
MAGGLREALESALDESPDDLASWMAYADHLAEQGDPRGELMQVQLALEDSRRPPAERETLQEREKLLLERPQREWLGELAGPLLDVKPTPYQVQTGRLLPSCRWARGGLGELRLVHFNLEVARALRDCPAARFLSRLDLLDNYAYQAGESGSETEPTDGVPANEEWFSALYVLHRAAFLPHLRFLRVGEPVDPDDETYDSGHCSALGLVGVLERTPRLEELHVLAKAPDLARLFGMSLPRLRALLLYHEFEYHPLRILAKNPGMPALRSLAIHPAHADGGESSVIRQDVVAFVGSPHFPALEELHLHASDLGDEGVKEIIDSGILKRLKVLDLRHGCVGNEGARLLAACPDVRRLERLELAYNEIGPEGVALLTGLGGVVRLGYQHEAGSDQYLYSGDME